MKIAALLICRGSVHEKVTLLTKLITDTDVNDENPKLARAIRFMFYLSVMLPYNFMTSKSESEIFRDIIFHEDDEFNSPDKRKSSKARQLLKKFLYDTEE